jgi:hypothetical protein
VAQPLAAAVIPLSGEVLEIQSCGQLWGIHPRQSGFILHSAQIATGSPLTHMTSSSILSARRRTT